MFDPHTKEKKYSRDPNYAGRMRLDDEQDEMVKRMLEMGAPYTGTKDGMVHFDFIGHKSLTQGQDVMFQSWGEVYDFLTDNYEKAEPYSFENSYHYAELFNEQKDYLRSADTTVKCLNAINENIRNTFDGLEFGDNPGEEVIKPVQERFDNEVILFSLASMVKLYPDKFSEGANRWADRNMPRAVDSPENMNESYSIKKDFYDTIDKIMVDNFDYNLTEGYLRECLKRMDPESLYYCFNEPWVDRHQQEGPVIGGPYTYFALSQEQADNFADIPGNKMIQCENYHGPEEYADINGKKIVYGIVEYEKPITEEQSWDYPYYKTPIIIQEIDDHAKVSLNWGNSHDLTQDVLDTVLAKLHGISVDDLHQKRQDMDYNAERMSIAILDRNELREYADQFDDITDDTRKKLYEADAEVSRYSNAYHSLKDELTILDSPLAENNAYHVDISAVRMYGERANQGMYDKTIPVSVAVFYNDKSNGESEKLLNEIIDDAVKSMDYKGIPIVVSMIYTDDSRTMTDFLAENHSMFMEKAMHGDYVEGCPRRYSAVERMKEKQQEQSKPEQTDRKKEKEQVR